MPLCTEPWESYYILRRGILPCCYGHPIKALMSDWREAWNCEEVQEIRRHLARGELSQYCRESLSCPIVQRVTAKEREERGEPLKPPPKVLRLVNKVLKGIPAKIYRRLKG